MQSLSSAVLSPGVLHSALKKHAYRDLSRKHTILQYNPHHLCSVCAAVGSGGLHPPEGHPAPQRHRRLSFFVVVVVVSEGRFAFLPKCDTDVFFPTLITRDTSSWLGVGGGRGSAMTNVYVFQCMGVGRWEERGGVSSIKHQYVV